MATGKKGGWIVKRSDFPFTGQVLNDVTKSF